MLDNGSCIIRGGKKIRFQNEVNQLNMVQEWDKEVFNQKKKKHNIDYNKCQKNN